jgi:hypothetical protein
MPKQSTQAQLADNIPIIEYEELDASDGGTWGRRFLNPVHARRYLKFAKQKNFIQNTSNYLKLVHMPDGTYRFRVIPDEKKWRRPSRSTFDISEAIDDG